MTAHDLPTEEQLADDLTKVARNGIGRSLPRQQGGKDVPYLWEAAHELVEDQTEDLPALIAKVVVPAVRLVEPRGEQEAVAEILWIDLKAANGYRKDDPPPLGTGVDNRYSRAAVKLGSSELDVKNNLRRPLLEAVGRLIRARLKRHRGGSATLVEPKPAAQDDHERETEPVATTSGPERKPPLLLIGVLGSALVAVGVAWLIAVATGALG